MVALAHVSDLHATPVRVDRVADFLNKRLLGWLSWRVRRRAAQRPEVLEALTRDLATQRPDHVVVTGDLTNVASAPEFPQARAWLERLGGPARVSAVPGNHDAYVPLPAESWQSWSDYLGSDASAGELRFPSLRIRGPLAIVGLCSAVPTGPFFASGLLGPEQLERLEKLLAELEDSPLCRVVLVHHPPQPGVVSSRRALRDGAALCEIIEKQGADLVLHGHGHRTHFGELSGRQGPIPVVGVRSASEIGSKPGKRAQYHLYDIEPDPAGPRRFRIGLRVRGYEADGGCFSAEGEREL